MRRRISIVLMATVWLTGSMFPALASAQDLYTNVKKSTVFIASYDYKGDLLGRGSGFFVDEGLVITNIHVIYGGARYYRVFATDDNDSLDPYCYRELNRSDIKINLDDDIAYIRVFLDCPHGSVYFADSDPKVGESIGIFGYPALGEGFLDTLDLIYTTGSVLEKTKVEELQGERAGAWLRTDAPIHGGNSGGPVVQDGKVVGVAVAAHVDENGNAIDGFFIPVSEIKRGLETASDSSFVYTPQEEQNNPVYAKPEEAAHSNDPFNPISTSGKTPSNADCRNSLGDGGEATGFVKQQGDGCRCKGSYHRDTSGTKCLPGSPQLVEQMERQKELKKMKKEDTYFIDIETNHPYIEAIKWGKESGILEGYPDGSFRPTDPVNRVEFLKIILEAINADITSVNEPAEFPDIDEGAWYAPYVRYAKANEIIEGYPDGTLQPEKTVNFAEALKIAFETLGVDSEDTGGEWYSRYLAHAKYNNILFTNEVDIGGDVSRQDVVWIVWQLLSR